MTIQNTFSNARPSLDLNFQKMKMLPEAMNFSRSSEGTCFDGTKVKMEENVLQYSQDLHQWAGHRHTKVGGHVAPDGSTTATMITCANTANTSSYIQSSKYSGAHKGQSFFVSCYLKAGTERYVSLCASNTTCFGDQGFVVADVGAGAGTIQMKGTNTFNEKVEDAGNGWWRVSFQVFATATDYNANCLIGFTNGTHPDYGTGRVPNMDAHTKDFYAWGAQLEQRDFLTPYTPTDVLVVSNWMSGLVTKGKDEPRFCVNPVTGESEGLLIEHAVTNITQERWMSLYRSIENPSAGIQADTHPATHLGPDGKISAYKYTASTVNGAHHLNFVGYSAGSQKVFNASLFVKKPPTSDGRDIKLTLYDKDGAYKHNMTFNLDTGAVSSVSGFTKTYAEEIGHGWWRVGVDFTTATGTHDPRIHVWIFNNSGATSYAAEAGKEYSLFLAMPQFKLDQGMTSYIYAWEGTVTRTMDLCDMPFQPNEKAGTLMITMESEMKNNQHYGAFTDYGGKDKLYIYNSSRVRTIMRRQNTTESNINFVAPDLSKNLDEMGVHTVAFAYDETGEIGVVDNDELTNTLGGVNWARMDDLSIGNVWGSTTHSLAKFRRVVYYPERLSNEELHNAVK